MVKVTRHIFELSDILAIRLRCSSCEREAVQPIAKTDVPECCPFCNASWELRHTVRLVHNLVSDLKLIQCQAAKPGVVIRFETDGEGNS